MKIYLFVLGAAMWVLLPANVLVAQQKVPTENMPEGIGSGFDSVAAVARAKCVVWDSVTTPNKAARTEHHIDLITDAARLFDAFDFGAGAKLNLGVFRANASFGLVSKRLMSRYGEYLSVRVLVENTRSVAQGVRLKDPERQLYKRDRAAFARRCGNQFVIGKVTGGELNVIFRSEARSEEQQRTTRATLGAAALVGEVNAELEAKLQNIAVEGRLKYDVLRKGPNEKVPSADVNAIIRYAQEYSTKVAPGSGNEWEMYFLLSDYKSIGHDTSEDTNQERVLDALGEQIIRAYSQVAGLEYLGAHPDEFGPFRRGALDAELIRLSLVVRSLQDQVSSCIQDAAKCSHPPPIILATLPRRSEWRDIDPRNNFTEICRTGFDEFRIVEAIGSWWTCCGGGQREGLNQVGSSHSPFQITDLTTGQVEERPSNVRLEIGPNKKIVFAVKDSVPGDNSPGNDGLRTRCSEPLLAEDIGKVANLLSFGVTVPRVVYTKGGKQFTAFAVPLDQFKKLNRALACECGEEFCDSEWVWRCMAGGGGSCTWYRTNEVCE